MITRSEYQLGLLTRNMHNGVAPQDHCTRDSDRIFICGHNQSDTLVCTDWIATPQTWAFVSGWWWKGKITITGEQFDAGPTPVKRRATREVPLSYPASLFWCETKDRL